MQVTRAARGAGRDDPLEGGAGESELRHDGGDPHREVTPREPGVRLHHRRARSAQQVAQARGRHATRGTSNSQQTHVVSTSYTWLSASGCVNFKVFNIA